MMTTSEKATQKKSMTLSRRSVHHANFLCALFQEEFVRSTTQRFVAARAGPACLSRRSRGASRGPLAAAAVAVPTPRFLPLCGKNYGLARPGPNG